MAGDATNVKNQSKSSESDAWNGLFPLPLTSIERFHLFDEQQDYPNVVFGKLIFDVALDVDRAKLAWQFAMQSHPFSNVEPELKKGLFSSRWFWRTSGYPDTPSDQWQHSRSEELSKDEAENWSAKRHRAPSQTGSYFGIYSDSDAQEAQVFFCVHHAVADGLACLRSINDWLIIYNNLGSERDPFQGTQRVDAGLMAKRNRLGLLSWSYLKHLPFQAIALFGAAKFIFRKTSEAIETADGESVSTAENLDGPFPSIQSRWIDGAVQKQVEQVAGKLEVTSTAWLLSIWFETLGQVRKERVGGDISKDWLRVIVPMSIRSSEDRRLPASNRTAIVQIDRQVPGDQFVHHVKMLHREIGIIRRFKLERMFLIFIRLFGLSNRILKSVAADPKSRGAAVFTDLHRPFLAAEKRRNRNQKLAQADLAAEDLFRPIKPVDFELAGPIRKGTPLNLAISRFEGKLKLSLHFDRQQVSEELAESILAKFEANIQKRI